MNRKEAGLYNEEELYSENWSAEIEELWKEILPHIKIAIDEIENNGNLSKSELETGVFERIKAELKK